MRQLILALLLLCWQGHPSAHAAGPRRLEVVATLPDVGALAREVAGERAHVSALLRGYQDPLWGEAEGQPERLVLLARADLLVAVGGPLEAGWLPRLLGAARNPRLAEYLDATRLSAPNEAQTYVLGDPLRAAALARALGAQLASLSADARLAAAYRLSGQQVAGELEARSRAWLTALAPLRGQRVLSYDDSFRSFLLYAGLVEVGPLCPGPGVPPTPLGVNRALRAMREGGVRLILQREYEPAHTARLLRDKTAAHILVLPLGARIERGERYVDAMDHLVRSVIAAHTVARAERKDPPERREPAERKEPPTPPLATRGP